jgi:hypothetical protein
VTDDYSGRIEGLTELRRAWKRAAGARETFDERQRDSDVDERRAYRAARATTTAASALARSCCLTLCRKVVS